MSTFVRTFRAGRQSDATIEAHRYASQHGVTIVSQSWEPGGRTGAASLFIVLGVLCLVVGLLFFPLWGLAVVFLVIGLVSGKGRGELTVVFSSP